MRRRTAWVTWRRALTTAACALPVVLASQNNALVLNGAYLILDGGTATSGVYLVVNQPDTAGIIRQAGGHIHSENQYHYVKWLAATATGNFVFPFGISGNASDYIPFTFNKTTTANSDLALSTWTTSQQNMPHAAATNVAAVTHMTGVPDSVNNAIDRFWDIQSPSVTGDLTFSYRGSENTTLVPADTFKAQHWNGASWDLQAGPGNPGVTTGIGTVGPIPGQSTFSPWILTRIALTASVSASVSAVCSGQCNGTATVTPMYGVSAYSYLWSNGQTTAVATGLCAGTHTCVVTDAVNASTTVTVNIGSLQPPVVIPVSSTVCAGVTCTLTVTGANTYTWSPAAGLNSSTGSAVSTTASVTTTYTVIGEDLNGCTDTTQLTLTVDSLPLVTVAADTICAGQTSVLTAGGAASYTWSANAGSATTSTVSVSPSVGVTTYTVTGESATTCVNSATVSVTVNALPSVTATAASDSICFGQSATLSASGASSYSWSPGATATSTITVNPASNTVYTVTGTTAGCSSSQTVAVVVHPLPAITGTPAIDTADCGMNNGQISGLSASGGTPAYTYQWLDSLGNVVATTATLSGAGPGNYTLIVTDANFCSDTSNTPFTLPGLGSISASITPALSQGSGTVVVNFTGSYSGASSFNWYFGNGTGSSQAVPPAATYTAAGTYTVVLLASNGLCVDTSYALVIVDEVVNIVIPNVFSPNNDGINDAFFIVATGIRNMHCDIYNRWGQLVYSLLAPEDKWPGVMNNGSEATDGTYYYILSATGIDGQEHRHEGYVTLVK